MSASIASDSKPGQVDVIISLEQTEIIPGLNALAFEVTYDKDAFELIFKHGVEKRGECRDLEFATCPVMVNTPCHECIFGDAHNAFELDESKVIEDVR